MKRKNYVKADWTAIPLNFNYIAFHNEGMFLFETKPEWREVEVDGSAERVLLGQDKERGTYIGQLRGAVDSVQQRPVNSRTVAAVIEELQMRERKGLGAYGTTVDRQDFSYQTWQQHLYEELLDAAVYLRRVMNFEIYSQEEHNTYMELYKRLPKRFTRSEAGMVGNDMCLDSDVVSRFLKNERLFEYANNHYTKRPL